VVNIPREIVGPQAQFERTGAQGFRDVRPLTTRLSQGLRGQASCFVLTLLASSAWCVPASATPAALTGVLYATWVLTRRLTLPIRLPRSARCRDWNLPDPATRKPRRSAGDIFIGNDQLTGQELWLTNEDGRQHGTIPGTTGAGKTTAIVSFLANALTQGSGFVLVDGKASNELYGEILALARRFGREDDVFVLNFLTASLPSIGRDGVLMDSQSNTFNPFSTGNADAIRELLVSQLGDPNPSDANGVFRGRAVALLGTMAPVLVWMRDQKSITINIEQIRQSLELRSIWTLAKLKQFLVRDPGATDPRPLQVNEIPADLLYPLLAYLGEIPGYNIDLPYNEQKTDEPFKQHGFALFYFTAAFTQLAVSLGHIFKVDSGDIDMRDIVLNRRILVVNLPALENSDDSLAALGKICVASLRGMMAQLLGARLEGDPKEIFVASPGMGQGPFHVVFDELAYYATNGMDRMLAMGRGLNMMFWLAFQEVGGIWARLGEKTYSLLGNANLTVAMRQQDSNRTREWLEKTAGQTYVTQALSYHGASDGAYREAQAAELRQVARVDWQDLQKLIEGEAIVLFGGRRIYARLFRAVLPDGPIRLNRRLTLAAPPDNLRRDAERIVRLREKINSGDLSKEIHPETGRALTPACPVITAFLDAFVVHAADDATFDACVDAGLAAAAKPIAEELARALAEDALSGTAAAPISGRVVTELDPMLDGREGERAHPSGPQTPRDPINAGRLALHTAIELQAGASRDDARANARAAIGERDAAAAAIILPAPPAMEPDVFGSHVRRVTAALNAAAHAAASAKLDDAAAAT
jgi:intracellular multiplication protein IcmO